jgi:hypothetical protein
MGGFIMNELINLGVSSETASGLSEPEHPWLRPCVHGRVGKALMESKPDIVVFCYGINDGIYYPFSNERFEAYKRGILSLIDKIRNDVVYRKFNLVEEVFPFKKKFHVIFCRNVMIYFDDETKRDLIRKFYNATEPGGYLFIGHSESINRDDTKYKYIMPAVYRKE